MMIGQETMSRVILVTGGFDPLHSGHIKLLKAAKEYSHYDKLIVGLNSDEWLVRKKGKAFQTWKDRANILYNLKCVDDVLPFDDKDDTAINAIQQCLPNDVIFCNGGDRQNTNTPEYEHFKNHPNIHFLWGVGGNDKLNSSSYIQFEKTERTWGYYKVLYTGHNFKVKELVINPNSSLSMQRHFHRSETWNLVSGNAKVIIDGETIELTRANGVTIPVESWHKGINASDKPAHIIEIWKGETDKLTEDDIERKRLIM